MTDLEPILFPTILYLASLSHRKGIFTLLDAFEIIVKSISDCRLLIAGSGTEVESISQRISHSQVSSNISLLGSIPRDRVPLVMNQCTVYCLPSYGEPYGISVLEAMACGKPVVATDTGGLSYLVSEQGGRKVPPRDSLRLANALTEILLSPELQFKMGKYNLNQIQQKFNREVVIDQLESIYYHVKSS